MKFQFSWYLDQESSDLKNYCPYINTFKRPRVVEPEIQWGATNQKIINGRLEYRPSQHLSLPAENMRLFYDSEWNIKLYQNIQLYKRGKYWKTNGEYFHEVNKWSKVDQIYKSLQLSA